MTNEDAMLALGGAFLRADLQVKVIHARSSESIYMNVSSGNGMPVVIRIANHKTGSKSFDFWIDTSHKLVHDHVNSVIRKVAYKFGREAFTISQNSNQEDREEVLEELQKVEKTYSGGKLPNNLLSLANWHLREDRPVFVDRKIELAANTKDEESSLNVHWSLELVKSDGFPYVVIFIVAMILLRLYG